MQWVDVCGIDEVPVRGSRVVSAPGGDIAVFQTAKGRIFALRDKCPHKGGPLSQGIVHGDAVTCPLHNWVIGLESGDVKGPDQGCARKVEVRVEGKRILLAADAFHRSAA
jgi:nitrite reductase (NADH) small subunit